MGLAREGGRRQWQTWNQNDEGAFLGSIPEMDYADSSFGNTYEAAETVATINSWGQWFFEVSAIS
jgi:hypothetical protein